MKQRIQGIIIGFLVSALLFSSVITVFALLATTKKNVDIYYGYNVYIDGAKFEPKYKGETIEAFNYGGWIYAPFEHIAKALGKEAYWDADTRSLYLGSMASRSAASFLDTVPPYQTGGLGNYQVLVVEKSIMGGNKYYDAISFYSSDNCYSLHNLSGQYKKITGYIGHVDGAHIRDATFNFYCDGKLVDSYELKADDLPRQILLDVSGVQKLKIEVQTPWGTYAFANATIE